MKTCSACKANLPLAQFYKNPGTKDKLGSQCRKCDREGKALRARLRKAELVKAFGGCCTDCGYAKCLWSLSFHHHGEDKEAEISLLIKQGKCKEAAEEAKKCTLLCLNCHGELHFKKHANSSYGGKRRGAPISHGTVAGYRGGCKCVLCKKEWASYMRQQRKTGNGVL